MLLKWDKKWLVFLGFSPKVSSSMKVGVEGNLISFSFPHSWPALVLEPCSLQQLPSGKSTFPHQSALLHERFPKLFLVTCLSICHACGQ